MRVVLLVFLIIFQMSLSHAQDTENGRLATEMNKKAMMAAQRAMDRTVKDSFLIYQSMKEAVSFSLSCDEYDRNSLGKNSGHPRYQKDNQKRLSLFVDHLLDAGKFFYRHHQPEDAEDVLRLYMQAVKSSLFPVQCQDNTGLAACLIGQYELSVHHVKSAEKLARIAMAYDQSALLGAEVMAECMRTQMLTAQDSLCYLETINALLDKNPSEEKYFAWLMSFLNHPLQHSLMERYIQKELENHPRSIVPWILKGELASKAKRWDEAIDAYKHADEIAPSCVPVAFNVAVCLNNKAWDMQNNQGKNGSGAWRNRKREVDQILAESRSYLERVRAYDPHRKQVDWVKPLYMVYQVLGDVIKAEELVPLVTGFSR